ncbi:MULTISPECIES: Rossmann-like and DUF2520 domain-containing protein [unclassified Ruegeria]|uniref:Rossmann-like and DUF2520 domain-containing protein n=1 Tax=unclassified Ruegeria TaxID=2625375 RepID=UPI001487DBA0|nr:MULTISPECIES: Rossmann-like and DUF2520 domain-containing protein [unclassified Ruegeria]
MHSSTVNIIGAGRVGQTIARLLQGKDGYILQDVLNARMQSAQDFVELIGQGRAVDNFAELRPADVWMLTVPDTQIHRVAEQIAEAYSASPTPSVALHCSGFFPADQMAPLRSLNWRLASVHPVLSFADPLTAARQFNGVLCGVEGDPEATEVATTMFEALGAKCFPIKSEGKSLYHAAAVISNNFTVVLQAIAREAWDAAGVPDDVAQQLNETLLRGTCDNVCAQGPKAALTGPAARGDNFVVETQGRDVGDWHPVAGRIYSDLSALAKSLSEGGKTRSAGD